MKKIILIMVLVLLSTSAMAMNKKEAAQVLKEHGVDKTMKMLSDKLSSGLPVIIAKDVSMVSVVYMFKKMYFRYSVSNEKSKIMSGFSSQALRADREGVNNYMINNDCNNPVFSTAMEEGVSFVYVYAHDNGLPIYDFEVTSADCK